MWIYLKDLTFSQVSEALPLHSETGCDQSHTAKSNPIAKASSCKECKKGICPKHQFGTIYEHYLKEILVKLSTSLSAASHDYAKTSVLQVVEKAWRESEADFFLRSCAWPKKSSPSSYSWKMCLHSQAVADYGLLERLPREGMIVDGVLYPLRQLEHCTKGKDGFYWLTPSTMDYLSVREGEALENALHRGNEHKSRRKVSGRLNEQVAYPQMWPTPAARDWKDSWMEASAQARKSPCLPAAVMMATPTASQASKPIRAPSPSCQNGSHGENIQDSIGRLNPELIGKKLCPRFVELLMGYPTEWSDLKPLGTQ